MKYIYTYYGRPTHEMSKKQLRKALEDLIKTDVRRQEQEIAKAEAMAKWAKRLTGRVVE